VIVIAIITAGLIGTGTVHAGSAPTVLAPNANPSVVFDRTAPAPAKSSPVSLPARPLPPPEHKPPKPAITPPQLARGLPYPAGASACYQYIVNPALDPKYQKIVNGAASQSWCVERPPGVPDEF
jgi:hypothetical protein